MLFGKNAAATEAQPVAKQNARRNQSKYPMVAKTVVKSTYMDDSLDSVETEDDGVELYHQLNVNLGSLGII